MAGGRNLTFGSHLVGDLAGIGAAVTWAAYSVLSRRFRQVPSLFVGVYCAATAALAWLCHAVFEPTVMPHGTQWLAIVAIGLGPVGAAFFAWDRGIKHGNLQALGALSYAAPLLSTQLLIGAGQAEPTGAIVGNLGSITPGKGLSSSPDS